MQWFQMEDQVAYEQGQQAAMRGETTDSCKYRLPSRKNAWVRGFNEIKNQPDYRKLSGEELRRGENAIAGLRRILES